MNILTFDDIQREIGLSKDTLNRIATRMSAATNGAEFLFTDLQLEAFNKKGYWASDNETPFPNHIVVQGATSSGKTLVSELLVIECLREKKKAVILVPLKAMVRERRDRFAHDLPNDRVYASSSDFQDHDTDIINGEYEVAVIVYEKFFAMLSQPSTQILRDCALLVVDELQMLSSEGRGPKLEISIQKVMRKNAELGTNNTQGTYTRIMCLTTCDCKIDYIKKWLWFDNREPLHIISPKRPIGLEEYIYTVDGTLEGRYIRGERDEARHGEIFNENPDPIKVEGYNRNNRPDVAKKLALIPLLKRIYEVNPNAKVLIFVSDRKNTRNLAEKIVQEGVLARTTETQELLWELQNYDNDESQEYLKQLIPYGIAFHNSTLSTALREFVEKSFEQKIKLVVATETLTIGMNMPVDVMIIYDTKVPRGKENREELTSQEYKNFVGRAGRLGQSNVVGQSYIFALNKNDAVNYRDMYVNCRKQDIKSSLLFAKEDVQAPYYLSLLTDRISYKISSLKELRDGSFSVKCGGRKLDMSLVMKELKKASLCNQIDPSGGESDEDLIDDNLNDDRMWKYGMSELGGILSPYAFHLGTCKKIRRYFLNGGYRKCQDGSYEKNLAEGAGGIPEGITADDIKADRYLLDILFLLCSTQEVSNLGQLRLPTGDNLRQAKDIIWDKLEEMTKLDGSNKIVCELWPNSKLRWILDGNSEHENEDIQIVMRAILLWYWTKGFTIAEIRNETKFKQFLNIYSGDLARLAELVSYELDAIYRCTSYFSGTFKIKYDKRGPAEIYALSTRVSYGMPRNLVIIANRHLYGMDRSVVLKIGKIAKEAGYDSPVKFLDQATKEELEGVISETLRNEILSMIDRSYSRDDFRSLLDTIQRNQVAMLSHEEITALTQLYDLKSSDESRVYEVLHIMFRKIGQDQNQTFRFFEDSVLLNNCSKDVFQMVIDGKTLTVADYDDGVPEHIINDYFAINAEELKLLLVKDRNILNQLYWDNEKGKYYLENDKCVRIVENIDVAMSCQNFAVLLAQTIALEDKKCLLLSALLHDLSGAFTPRGNRAIYCLLKNYQPEKRYSSVNPQALRLVCDYQCGNDDESVEKLFAELETRGIDFRVISWGEQLKKESGEDHTVFYISKASICTKSMSDYFTKVRKRGFRKACAIFDNESDYLQLSEDPQFPYAGLKHYSGGNLQKKAQYVKFFAENRKMTEEREKTYYLGVSYSHTLENHVDRPAVIALKKIVRGLNEILGEENIVFDGNDSFKEEFSRNNALSETLELYDRCLYYLILDDHYYTDGDSCLKEKEVIKKKLDNSSNEYSQRVWFLRPKNDTSSCLFDNERDYSTLIDFTDENIQAIIDSISRVIINCDSECRRKH